MDQDSFRLDKLMEIIVSHLEAMPLVLYIHGSRAYGYASPKSDYDIRGIFIELDPTKYISAFKTSRKEIHIEEPPYDIRLWELRKFVSLVYSFNPIVYELLQSKPVYISEKYKDQCLEIIKESRSIIFSYKPRRLFYHYYGMFRSWLKYFDKTPKKAIYHIIRCFLALTCIARLDKFPPVKLEELIGLMKSHYPEIVVYAEMILDAMQRGEDISPSEQIVGKIKKEIAKFLPIEKMSFNIKEKSTIIDNIVIKILRKHICGGE